MFLLSHAETDELVSEALGTTKGTRGGGCGCGLVLHGFSDGVVTLTQLPPTPGN